MTVRQKVTAKTNSVAGAAFGSERSVVVADWEGGAIGWRVVRRIGGDFSEEHFSKDHVLDGTAWKGEPSDLVIEHAHLHPRGPRSVAQVYNELELRQLHGCLASLGWRMFAFPQRLTRRARIEGGYADKTDDPRAIYDFIESRPEVSLKRWQPLTDASVELHETVNAIRLDMTLRLNSMRPDYAHPDVNRAMALLDGFADDLPDSAREQFGIRRGRDGELNRKRLNKSQVMTAFVCAFDADGNLRRNPRGEFIGIRFIWSKLLLMSPFHGHSGTARSNLMHHGLKHFDKKNSGSKYEYGADDDNAHKKRRAIWSTWRAGVKRLIRAFRDAQPDFNAPQL